MADRVALVTGGAGGIGMSVCKRLAEAGCRVTSADVSFAGESASGHDAHAAKERNSKERHRAESAHSEFHADYAFACSDVNAIATIRFPFFEAFPNSEELAVTLITEKGQKAFEVSRENAFIDTRGMM